MEVVYFMVKVIPKEKSFDLRCDFNELCMRELSLGITDEDLIYNMEDDSILKIKDKFIRYIDIEGVLPRNNEIEMNLIENSRLMETLSLPFLDKWARDHGYTLESFSQDKIQGTSKGVFTVSYNNNGLIEKIMSDQYYNESVRVFSLICKINHTTHLYSFEDYDVQIDRSK